MDDYYEFFKYYNQFIIYIFIFYLKYILYFIIIFFFQVLLKNIEENDEIVDDDVNEFF